MISLHLSKICDLQSFIMKSRNAYTVLIQDIKDLLASHNFTVQHYLHERNQCANFMVKLGASSYDECFIHSSPPQDLPVLLRNDAVGIYFPRA